MIPLLSRGDWNARPAKGHPTDQTSLPDTIYIHHTGGRLGGGPAEFAAIQKFHQDGRGWTDVGYNFMVDPAARQAAVGRGAKHVGAHVSGHNDGSVGIAVLGNFQNQHPVPDTLPGDLAGLIWFLRDKQLVTADCTVKGHRDDGQTACPGDDLYALLPQVRALLQPTSPDVLEWKEAEWYALEAAKAARSMDRDFRWYARRQAEIAGFTVT